MYADVAYFGHGFYGLAAASCGYFGNCPPSFPGPQAAMLAGLVLAPSADNPLDHPARARAREAHVLGRLVATRTLTRGKASTAFAQPLSRLVDQAVAAAPLADDRGHGWHGETAGMGDGWHGGRLARWIRSAPRRLRGSDRQNVVDASSAGDADVSEQGHHLQAQRLVVPVDVCPMAGSPADPRVGDAGQEGRDDLFPEGEQGADGTGGSG